MGPVEFDEGVAAVYDDAGQPWNDPAQIAAIVDRLADLADGGAALELGVGTGRIAIPLATRGVDVHGIDVSAAMLARLRANPAGSPVRTTLGDMATTRVPGSFAVVYVVFNTISNLGTQAEQVACFRNAAAHLSPGGTFVVELFVPDLRRLPPGASAMVMGQGPGQLDVDELDPLTQRLVSHHHRLVEGEWQVVRTTHRYAWPAELDLMAELAGLRLRDRWGGWHGEPFTADSTTHVSMWERPATS